MRQLAIQYQVDAHKQVRLPGSTVFACLLHGLLPPQELTQRLLEETFRQRTGQSADHSRLPARETAPFGKGQETRKEQAAWNPMPLWGITGGRFDTRDKVWKAMRLHAGPYSFGEVASVYGERWEIALFFKLIKPPLALDPFVSRSENGILALLYRTLILSWLLLWYQRQTGIERGWRSVKSWLAHARQEWVALALRAMRVLKPPPERLHPNTS